MLHQLEQQLDRYFETIFNFIRCCGYREDLCGAIACTREHGSALKICSPSSSGWSVVEKIAGGIENKRRSKLGRRKKHEG